MRHLKRAVPMLLLFLLCACGTENTSAQTALSLRSDLLSAGACQFSLAVTADYGTWTKDYAMDCVWSGDGASLTVTQPELAAGITGTVSGADATVSFDDTVLAMEEFASRQIAPLAAPYILGCCWSDGYISAAGVDGEQDTAIYTYGYGNSQLSVETWFSDGLPVQAEISDGEQVLLTCSISEFQFKTKDDSNAAIAENMGGDQPESSDP